MKQLTKTQKDFLIEKFFKNEKFAGAKNVAEKLLEKGECIVAGEECIWRGGIGNFIKTTKADDVFGCLKYSFNLEYFMTSEFFKNIVDREKKDLCLSIKAMEQKYAEISELNK
jgi:hypothetical protein